MAMQIKAAALPVFLTGVLEIVLLVIVEELSLVMMVPEIDRLSSSSVLLSCNSGFAHSAILLISLFHVFRKYDLNSVFFTAYVAISAFTLSATRATAMPKLNSLDNQGHLRVSILFNP
jgi:FlaA1/EpsC-like NDP-sugar epimerase